jgi:hypothetical protein
LELRIIFPNLNKEFKSPEGGEGEDRERDRETERDREMPTKEREREKSIEREG